jgi:Bacterial regulatory proteins, luxR family
LTVTFTDSRRAPRSRFGRSFSITLPLIRFDVLATTRRPARATIAQSRFVTPKTVEVHLSSAYRKLGIGSRTQLAAALQ